MSLHCSRPICVHVFAGSPAGITLPTPDFIQQHANRSIYEVFDIEEQLQKAANATSNGAFFALPLQSGWVYVSPVDKFLSDVALREYMHDHEGASFLVDCKRAGWTDFPELDEPAKVALGISIIVAVFLVLMLVKNVRAFIVNRMRRSIVARIIHDWRSAAAKSKSKTKAVTVTAPTAAPTSTSSSAEDAV